ncbi:acyltransferase family protein [Microbacterium sp. NPDC056044]|uniref:acyltransferase family protein n=1 Tax=Microbacterium sp. NPDC056044 TaxID=3345690 RepID=UPI0035D9F394
MQLKRLDIQGLRALAVTMVVVFHLWPHTLQGGYIGVDVFFVVSGYLITAHLLSEVARTGSVSVTRFWARRIRRLLPASFLVLAFCVVFALWVVPRSLLVQNLQEIAGAAGYYVNWLLAFNATDYLASENSDSLVQHYWSLSTEEQFYVVWPLLVVAAVFLAKKVFRTSRLLVISITLAIVFAASLAFSVWETATNPPFAYFITPTRAWEFAAGGLVALLPAPRRGSPGSRKNNTPWSPYRLLSWLALAAVLGSALLFTADTPFPGWIALLPVLGTAFLLWVGDDDHPWSPQALWHPGPIQFLGDISYSVYLWHWPLIIISPFVLGLDSDFMTGILVLGATLLLATLTKAFVEDPARRVTRIPRIRRGAAAMRRERATVGAQKGMSSEMVVDATAAPSPPRAIPTLWSRRLPVYAFMLTGMLFFIGGPWAMIASIRAETVAEQARIDEEVADGASCFGAGALLSADAPCSDPEFAGTLTPSLAARGDDTDGAFGCYLSKSSVTAPNSEVRTDCRYGSASPSALRVALVGDSHGAMLVPGLLPLLDGLGWQLDVFVANGGNWVKPSEGDARESYQRSLDDMLVSGGYDVILTTQVRQDRTPEEASATAQRLADTWAPAIAAGAHVVAVVDNPYLTDDMESCVQSATDQMPGSACEMPPTAAFSRNDPFAAAAALAGPGGSAIDMSAAYCANDSCPAVIGNVLVYRDQHHITATYSQSLGPYLAEAVNAAAGLDAGAG